MDQLSDVKREISRNISRVTEEGAEYTDVRFYTDDSSETLVLYDGNLEANDTTFESGIGVRVLWEGAWGFAATSNPTGIRRCFDSALQNARTAASLIKVPLTMGKKEGHSGSYSSPVKTDPFTVSLKDKLGFLENIDCELTEDWILRRVIFANFQRKQVLFRNSEGTEIVYVGEATSDKVIKIPPKMATVVTA